MKSKGEDTTKQEIKVHELWKKVESKWEKSNSEHGI
jgi:hypothetical protein